ncbi:MAG: sn-glycerol-3-phosphate ABC transporter ATP-binding protein UgpC [Corynebacterium glutamicum]|nr:sn-glycerol-3-phosphate ABC transporter ATP-binding protein UgpC [Corynebacterium glutamicum]
MASVSYRNATRTYPGAPKPAVDSFNLEIADGEFMVFVGPSGSGKSTALRMLAGLEDVTEGSISLGDREITETPPKDRDIAMVFQNYALYPHMTVADNMGYALKIQGMKKDERLKRVREAAEILGLEPYLDRKPKNLSGGQRQRVAMGRAIVRRPSVFLMDEPLSNLDAKLRVQTRAEISALQKRLGVTTVYVTHDQVEAMTMGDRVAVIKDGMLQQVDKPLSLYDAPANLFVAGFIGSPAMCLLDGEVSEHGVKVGDSVISVPREVLNRATGKEVVIGIRPEKFTLDYSGGSIKMVIDSVEQTGSDTYLYGKLQGSESTSNADRVLIARVAERISPNIGEVIELGMSETSLHIFDRKTEERISGRVAASL